MGAAQARSRMARPGRGDAQRAGGRLGAHPGHQPRGGSRPPYLVRCHFSRRDAPPRAARGPRRRRLARSSRTRAGSLHRGRSHPRGGRDAARRGAGGLPHLPRRRRRRLHQRVLRGQRGLRRGANSARDAEGWEDADENPFADKTALPSRSLVGERAPAPTSACTRATWRSATAADPDLATRRAGGTRTDYELTSKVEITTRSRDGRWPRPRRDLGVQELRHRGVLPPSPNLRGIRHRAGRQGSATTAQALPGAISGHKPSRRPKSARGALHGARERTRARQLPRALRRQDQNALRDPGRAPQEPVTPRRRDEPALWHRGSRGSVCLSPAPYSDERIEHLAVQDPRVPRLRSVPSVGPVTAAAFIAAIDDAQRCRHAHQLEAHLSLHLSLVPAATLERTA